MGNDEVLTVRIVGCTGSYGWYSKMIGQVAPVKGFRLLNRCVYIIVGDSTPVNEFYIGYPIDVDDASIIPATPIEL